MKNKSRELTDRNKGISNTEREKKYQEYVRGWEEYFRVDFLSQRINGQDAESERSIGNIRTRYRILRKLKLEHWQAMKLANSRCGYWRIAEMLGTVITNKIMGLSGNR